MTFGEKIEIKTILAVKKPQCREVRMENKVLATLVNEKRIDVAVFEGGSCVYKTKVEVKGEIRGFAVGRNTVYLLDAEGNIRRVSRVGEKYIETAKYTPPEKSILSLKVLEVQE